MPLPENFEEQLLDEIVAGRRAWWWLSFADPDRPAGQQFLGAAVVEACGMMSALDETFMLGINPGGEVKGVEIPAAVAIPAAYRNRLLSRADCEALDSCAWP